MGTFYGDVLTNLLFVFGDVLTNSGTFWLGGVLARGRFDLHPTLQWTSLYLYVLDSSGLKFRVFIRKLISYFSPKTYVVGTQKNRLNETVLLSTQNIC